MLAVGLEQHLINMNQRELWEKLFEKKDRYGLDPDPFAIESLKRIEKIKAKKILDLSGGEGKHSIFFAKNGYEVFCLDFSKRAIASCKEKVVKSKLQKLVHPIIYDITKPLKFKDKTFDAVFAHLAVHYFDDKTTTEIFNEIHRILKVGGLFFAKVKSIKDPSYGKGKKIEKDMFDFGHTRHFFSKEYLLSKLEGFKVLSLKEIVKKTDYAKKAVSKKSIFLLLIAKKI